MIGRIELMIPCKEDKCLKLAICKSKRTIFCTRMYQFMYEDNVNWHDGFEFLPNLIDLYRDAVDNKYHEAFDGAPIINSVRLQMEMEKNTNEKRNKDKVIR